MTTTHARDLARTHARGLDTSRWDLTAPKEIARQHAGMYAPAGHEDAYTEAFADTLADRLG